MQNRQFTFQSELPVSVEDAFAWHLRKGALERLLPPWMNFTLLFPPGTPGEEGSRVGLKLTWGPFGCKWILEHRDSALNQGFSDVQIHGPFSRYLHRHLFLPIDQISCRLSDEVTYAFPLPFFDQKIQKELSHFFSWRHTILREDLKTIDRYSKAPLRILLSGASGLIGSHLKVFLQLAGHQVVRLVRRQREIADDAIYWDPIHGVVEKEDFEGFDTVIHLAGAGIAQGRWTKKKKGATLFKPMPRHMASFTNLMPPLPPPKNCSVCFRYRLLRR